jgi:pimeloyl-ACP methyl ester carboxylesterase
MNNMQHGFAHTDHGRIHYLEKGIGRPLVLAHSNGQSAHVFEQVAERLASDYRVIAIDLPGHGDSDRITAHYSVDRFADAVVAFADAMGLKTFSFAGSSIGGFVAIALGVRHASRIENLFVVEVPLRTQQEKIESWESAEAGFNVVLNSTQEVASRLHGASAEKIVERWNADRAKAGAWSMVQVMWAIRDYDAAANLRKIAARTKAIMGEHASAAKLYRETYASLRPDIPVTVIANSGHFPMLDNPDALAAAIREF